MEMENKINEIKNRTFNIGDILSLSWQIYLKNIKPLVIIVLVVYFPLQIINLLIPYDIILIKYGENGVQLVQTIFRFINLFIRFIGMIAIILIASGDVQDIFYTHKQALKESISIWGKLLATSFLGGLIIIGFTLLLVIPGIIRSVQYAFVSFIVILRNINGKAALDYSKQLVEGQWWRVFGTNFIIQIIAYPIGLILGLIFYVIPNVFFTELVVYTFAEVVDVFFTVALTVFFLNIDYLKNKNNYNEEGQVDLQLDESIVTP